MFKDQFRLTLVCSSSDLHSVPPPSGPAHREAHTQTWTTFEQGSSEGCRHGD